mmetsp:Transcript_7303/g.11082  ORF Transcript_7303/g.11082 Transcript_7303/m.11082 type:complete len:113 (-) Transcript_7303:511-849(-)
MSTGLYLLCDGDEWENCDSLSSDEILVQMFFARKICRLEQLPPVTNVVFMGMGEPADNAEEVIRASRILTTRGLFQLGAGKVTISTVALTPEILSHPGRVRLCPGLECPCRQ